MEPLIAVPSIKCWDSIDERDRQQFRFSGTAIPLGRGFSIGWY